MAIVKAILGLIVLLAGRKLYWLFVGAAGFAAATVIVGHYFGDLAPLVALAISLGAGLVGALLAVALQRVALGIGGFLGGGAILVGLLNAIGLSGRPMSLLAFLVGGIIGVILVVSLFDWALIILSSLTGAILIVQALQMGRPLQAIVFLAIAVAGMVLQGRAFAREDE